MKYGLTVDIKKNVDKKIESNKEYLKNLTFYNNDYKLVSMFDSDLNANLSPHRYFSEVANRVNTLFALSKELDLVPAFLTITLPSEFHIKSDNYNGFSPRQSALYLSDIWAKFLRKKIFKHIKEQVGTNMIYIRVYEPHKSGVPHLHAMIFLPKNFLELVKNSFYEHYLKYGFKFVGLKFLTNFKNAKYENSKGAIAYILKYMNKTFKSAKDDCMTDEAYYFAYHRIRRFMTSQTLIPLYIYRKIKHDENNRDLLKMTKEYNKGNLYTCFDKEFIVHRKFVLKSFNIDNDVIDYDAEFIEKILYQKNHFISNQFKTKKIVYDTIPTVWKKSDPFVPIYKDDKIISHFRAGKFYPFKIPFSLMKPLQLLEYYNNYDVDLVSNPTYNIFTKKLNDETYQHYLSLRNYLIEKKLLSFEKINIDSFDIQKFFTI